MNNVIETVIFDFGGVLINLPEHGKISHTLGKMGIRSAEHAQATLMEVSRSQKLRDVMTGRLTEREMWRHLAQEMQVPHFIMKQFVRVMNSPKNLNTEMLAYVKSLKGRYKLGILSNAGDEARSLMTKRYHFDQLVEEIVISAEEGVAKPDEEIYKIAVARMRTGMEACLFIDDFVENVEAARALGMQAIHFTDNPSCFAQLDSLLSERN